jgi:hypothetical protein
VPLVGIVPVTAATFVLLNKVQLYTVATPKLDVHCNKVLFVSLQIVSDIGLVIDGADMILTIDVSLLIHPFESVPITTLSIKGFIRTYDKALKKLLPISDQLVELKLTASGVTDKDLSILQGLKNIEKLWLDETQITDQGIKEVSSLPKLIYINLASTGATKSGVENLLENKSIQSVYLYQTRIDPTEIALLKNKWKAVRIFGADSMIKMPTDTIFQRKVK